MKEAMSPRTERQVHCMAVLVLGQRRVVGAACIGAALILSGPGSDRPVTSPNPIPLYEWEAKTLVLLVPDVQEALHEGYTVDLARDMTTEASKLNSSVYYAFRVNLLGDSPSSLLDYWGVNRFTGDVLHSVESDELENGSDLRVVQGVLRRVHNLTDDVLERYRKEPPFRR